MILDMMLIVRIMEADYIGCNNNNNNNNGYF